MPPAPPGVSTDPRPWPPILRWGLLLTDHFVHRGVNGTHHVMAFEVLGPTLLAHMRPLRHVGALLAEGVPVGFHDTADGASGWTALKWAAQSGNTEIIGAKESLLLFWMKMGFSEVAAVKPKDQTKQKRNHWLISPSTPGLPGLHHTREPQPCAGRL